MGEGEWSIILGGLGCKEHYFGWVGMGALFENAQVILLLSFKVLDFLHKLLKKLRKYYFNFFDFSEKILLEFNHSAPNCMKSLLIIFSISVKLTSA